jgi:alcohol dehydrogenase (NADP+)
MKYYTLPGGQRIATLDQGYRFVDGSFFTGPGSPYTLEALWNE